MNSPLTPKLISFDLCPFVQRAVILLLEKKIDFDITYIDLANKPEWFLAISPLGKVPLLQVGEDVIFESGVILEYLDEAYPKSFHPSDLVKKAKNRAWCEFASQLFMAQYQLCSTPSAEDFDTKKVEITTKLKQLEGIITGPYFNGEEVNLVDFSYAPFFLRLNLVGKAAGITLDQYPKVRKWSEVILSRPSTLGSAPKGFDQLFTNYLVKSGSHMGKKLA